MQIFRFSEKTAEQSESMQTERSKIFSFSLRLTSLLTASSCSCRWTNVAIMYIISKGIDFKGKYNLGVTGLLNFLDLSLLEYIS